MENEIIKYRQPTLHMNMREMRVVCDNSYRPAHFHRDVEIIYVRSGELCVVVDGKETVLRSRESILINNGVVHYVTPCSVGAEAIFIQLEVQRHLDYILSENDRLLCSFIGSRYLKRFIIDSQGYIEEFVNTVYREDNEKLPAYEIYIKAEITKLAAYMSREKLLPYFFRPDESKLGKLIPLLRHIERNYSLQITLDEACECAGVSKFYFCRQFKQLTGATFTEYLNYVRLLNVERELENSDRSISDIAWDCGFTSIQYFNKVFRKNKGYTPSEYRKMLSDYKNM